MPCHGFLQAVKLKHVLTLGALFFRLWHCAKIHWPTESGNTVLNGPRLLPPMTIPHESLVEQFWGIPQSLKWRFRSCNYDCPNKYSHQWIVNYGEVVMDMADPHIHRYAIIWHMLPWYMGYFSFLYLVCCLSISPFPGLAVPELTYAPTKATGKFHHKWMISGGILRRIRVLFWFLFDVWVRVLCPAEWSWCFFSQLWCSIIHIKFHVQRLFWFLCFITVFFPFSFSVFFCGKRSDHSRLNFRFEFFAKPQMINKDLFQTSKGEDIRSQHEQNWQGSQRRNSIRSNVSSFYLH